MMTRYLMQVTPSYKLLPSWRWGHRPSLVQIPNQPVIFDADGIPRKEDKLVALTWKKAMDTGNYMYPAYLPMVKSVVKAMDGIQAVVISRFSGL